MTLQTRIAKVMATCARCTQGLEYTFKSYKFKSGVILIAKYEFLGSDFELKKLENATIVSIEETGKRIELTEEEYREIFFDSTTDKAFVIATQREFDEVNALFDGTPTTLVECARKVRKM